MPNLDKMGPQGKGPGTGRGQGNCKKDSESNPIQGLSIGRKKGLRRGNGNRDGQGVGRNCNNKSNN